MNHETNHPSEFHKTAHADLRPNRSAGAVVVVHAGATAGQVSRYFADAPDTVTGGDGCRGRRVIDGLTR